MRLTAAAASALALGLVLAFSGHVAGQGFVGSSGSCSCNETTTLLDCSSIGLLSLNGNISACQSLEAILLDHNQLSFLPSNYFDELTTLQKLDLSFNQFFFIPGDYFGNQTSLVILDLSHNSIVQGGIAADAFANMISLESLNISGNNPLTVNANLFANLINLLTLTCNGVVTCTNGAGANVTCPNTGAVSDSDLNLLFDCLMMSTTTATPASTTAVTTTTAPAVVTTTAAASATTTAAASGTTTAAAPGTTTAASATTTAAAPATTTTAAANGTTTAFQCPPVDASSCQISATKRWARDANGCWFCFDYASTTAAPPTSSGSGPTTTPFQCPPIVASSCQISATKKWALDANGCWFCFDFASTAAPATTTAATTTAATTSVPTTTAATTTVATTTLPTTGAATTGAANTTTVATTQPATGATTNAPVTLGVATNSSVKVVIQGSLGSCSCNATSTVLDCSNLGLNDSSLPANIAASCPHLVSANFANNQLNGGFHGTFAGLTLLKSLDFTGNTNLVLNAAELSGLHLVNLSCSGVIVCSTSFITGTLQCPSNGSLSQTQITIIQACPGFNNTTTATPPAANTTTANPTGGNATTTVAPPATTTTAAPSGGSTTTVFKCPPISALSCNISDTKRWALDANGCWFCFDYASTAPASTSTGSASVPTTVAATTTTTTTAAAASSTTVTETRPLNQTTTETRPPLNQTTTASSAQTTTTAAPAGGSTTTTVFKCPPISALSCNISATKRWALDANGCWFCFDYASTAPASPPTTTTTGRPTTTTVKPTTAKPTTTTAKATTTAKTTAKPVTTTTAKPATTSSNAAGSGGFTCPPLYRANCPNGNIRWALDARGCWYSFCG